MCLHEVPQSPFVSHEYAMNCGIVWSKHFKNGSNLLYSTKFHHLSPPQRPLCIVGRLLCCGEAGEKEKESARGTMGRGKREERPLPYNVRKEAVYIKTHKTAINRPVDHTGEM